MATSISRRAEGATPIAFPRPTGRTVALWAFALLLSASAAFFVSRSSVLHIRRIEVSGLRHLPPSSVVRESGVSTRMNALWLDTSAAEAALEEDPWIASAEVERVLPWTIRIRVVERSPVAEIPTLGGYELMAADGTGLGTVADDPGLPHIIGAALVKDGTPPPDVLGAAVVVAGLDEHLSSMVRDVGVTAGGAVQMRLRGGIQVNLGEPVDISRKVAALTATLRWAKEQRVSVRTIDVSAPQAPAVRFGS